MLTRCTTRALVQTIALAAVFMVFAAGCAREAPLPPGQDLLREAAQELPGLASVQFNLEVAGPLGEPAIQRANGVLTREGDASGAFTLEASGTPVEYEFVISGGRVYLKGLTAGFRALPPALSDSVYNPARLLSPSGGLADILTKMSGARTEAAEPVGGTQAYRVTAMVDAKVLQGPLPVQLKEGEVPVSLWIGRDRPVLLKALLTPTFAGAQEPTTMTVTLSDFNVPVDITPPPT